LFFLAELKKRSGVFFNIDWNNAKVREQVEFEQARVESNNLMGTG
jgi:hypothetical protein